MKKAIVILFSLVVTIGVTAQPKIGGGFRGGYSGGGGVHYVRPRVTVVAPMYPAYGYGLGYGLGLGYGFGYSPFYSPYYGQRYEPRPTELDLQIDDIKNEYDFKISSVKHDKSLSKDDRKQQVRDLKHQREDAIIDAKKSYYSEKDQKRGNNENGNNQ